MFIFPSWVQECYSEGFRALTYRVRVGLSSRSPIQQFGCVSLAGKAVGFVGPFDAVMRDGVHPNMASGMKLGCS